MRKPITPTAHVGLDYGLAAMLFAAPSLLGLSRRASNVSYLFGAITTAVTMVTRNKLAPVPAITIRQHGRIETPTLPTMLIVPALAGAMKEPAARALFLGAFGVALLSYLMTDFAAEEEYRAHPSYPPTTSLLPAALVAR